MSTCIVCNRRAPERGCVCDGDRAAMAKMLTDLPRKIAKLALQLVPGQAVAGDRVSTSRTGSPTPVRLDALSLTGPGAEHVVVGMHPLIRRWSTKQTVQVTPTFGPDAGKVLTRTIIEWHQELIRDEHGEPVMVDDNDQTGVVPPAEWLDAWVRAWRVHFGHSVPQRTYLQSGQPSRGRLTAEARRRIAAQMLGLVTISRGTVDLLEEEWETRFGEPTRAEAPAHDVAYLLTWLDEACDQNAKIAAFAAELRSLSAELTRVLGERPDQQWLGRCPTPVTDVNSGTTKTCGAGLWQDPYTGVYTNGSHTGPGQVECPRCHSVWAQRDLLRLALEIRKTWPVDRRRRYHREEVDATTAPACPGCGQQTRIVWREVTARTDDRRWWRPERVVCPDGCPDTERLI